MLGFFPVLGFFPYCTGIQQRLFDLFFFSLYGIILHTLTYLVTPSTLEMQFDFDDEGLMRFVNMLGVITFTSIVVYHFIVASPKDAEL